MAKPKCTHRTIIYPGTTMWGCLPSIPPYDWNSDYLSPQLMKIIVDTQLRHNKRLKANKRSLNEDEYDDDLPELIPI